MNIPDDPQLAAILDDYLSDLQAGKRPDREALLPNIRSWRRR